MHFRTNFSGGLVDVHWGLPDLDFEKPMAICPITDSSCFQKLLGHQPERPELSFPQASQVSVRKLPKFAPSSTNKNMS